MLLYKLKYYYITVSSEDRLSVERYADDMEGEDPLFKLCIEGESGRFEIRDMELNDLKDWRNKIDVAIRQEEERAKAAGGGSS